MSDKWTDYKNKFNNEYESNKTLKNQLDSLNLELESKKEEIKLYNDKLDKSIDNVRKDYENRILELKTNQIQSEKTLNETKNKIIEDLQRTLEETKNDLNMKLNEYLKYNDKLTNDNQ